MIIVFFLMKSNIILNILNSPIYFIGSFLFTVSLILFYLDDFKLSNCKFIKYMQIFNFIFVPLYIVYFLYNIPYTLVSDVIIYAKDNNDLNLHGHVTLDKEAGKAISQGMQTVGSNIGLGASIAGVSTAVGKTIAKSSIPPLQKAAIVADGGLLGGVIPHVKYIIEYIYG